jgi:hypothetical protein
MEIVSSDGNLPTPMAENSVGKAGHVSELPSEPGISTTLAIRFNMTPPETPFNSGEAERAQAPPALFHNYLRAFYPFHGSTDVLQGEDAKLVTAQIRPGDLILVHSVHANGWADGTVVTTGERGWLPTNYCETYDHPFIRSLLNAMTQFWDLLGANENANLSTFVRQDYIRGLIAGVRYLLERSDCLHRDSALVQRHTGIRRLRKGLLADLQSLVHIAKGLHETISEPYAGEVIHFLLEDVMAKAFKVVIRAVGFVDMWAQETSQRGLDSSTATPRHSATLSVEHSSLSVDTETSVKSDVGQPVDSAKAFPDPEASAVDNRQDDPNVYCRTEEATPALPAPMVTHKGSVTHRLSVIDSDHLPSSSMASERLAQAHDLCISHIGAFIGHHLHSRPASELVATTERVVQGCHVLLAVIESIHEHDTSRPSSAQRTRLEFQVKLDEMTMTTKDVFTFSDSDDGNAVMLPQQTERLISVGTALIRTGGECVAKTRSLIERIGDFELDGKDVVTSEESLEMIDQPSKSQQTAGQKVLPPARIMTSFEKRLSRKLAPHSPLSASGSVISTIEISSADASNSAVLRPETPTSTTSANLATPSMRRRSAIRVSHHAISGSVLRSPGRLSYEEIAEGWRKDSVGLSIASSTGTGRSSIRDSGISAVSESSTRATTPDKNKDGLNGSRGLVESFTSMPSLHSTVIDSPGYTEEQLLQKTFASELILNKDGQVAGGSLPALVERLTTHDSAPDPQFMTAFYLTFRSFSTPREVAQALIARFDYIAESGAAAAPVRLRVYNVFKGWLETYWHADADKEALGDVRYFALHKLKPHLNSAGDRLLDLIRKVTAGYQTGNVTGPLVSGVGKTSLSIAAQHSSESQIPEAIVTKGQLASLKAATSGGAACSILEFDSLELARQLTLITSHIYCSIQPDELLSLDWGKRATEKAQNVRTMGAIHTDLAHIVGDTILGPDDAKKRAALIKHWTKIAHHCLELHNYDSLVAIMSSLNSSVVQRLRRTWELVSRKTRVRLAELDAVVDLSRNQASLRRRLEAPIAPCIPFIGIYLTDLTFLDAGNPRTRELPGARTPNGESVSVINFDKHMRMAKVISHLQKFQVPYNLQPVPGMQAWMQSNMSRMRASKDELVCKFHRRSLLVEPKQDEMKPPKTADAKRNESVGGGEERPKTSNKERFETFLKDRTFTLKALGSQDQAVVDAAAEKQS